MQRGRPLKFESPKLLKDKIEEYFKTTPEDEWMITGLAVHLDTSRETLMDYEKGEGERADFSDTIKRAKVKIEQSYERRGIKRGNAFDIFALKNFGWKDQQEVKQTNVNYTKDVSDMTDEELKKILSN